MRRTLRVVCAVSCALSCALARDARAESFIVKDGQPQAEIVVAGDAVPAVKLAAQDLAVYVEKLSGARLPVVNAPGPNVPVQLYVGRSAFTDKLNVRADDLEHDAYRMVSVERGLVLIGRDRRWEPKGLMKLAITNLPWPAPDKRTKEGQVLWDQWDKATGEYWGLPFSQVWKDYNSALDLWAMDERGTFNAVTAFLYMQGVRWYMPGDLGEVVPRKATIPLPQLNTTVRPDFELRHPYLYSSRFTQTKDLSGVMWQMRMGFSYATDIFGVGYRAHGIAHVIGREETKKAHPEYYALIGGRRVTEDRFARSGRPCLSSPELAAANVRYLDAMFNVFGLPMESVMPVDGFTAICQCPLCQGRSQPERGWQGQFSNYVWDYTNKVAQGVAKTHPDRKVAGMAYTTYMLPPTDIEKFSPNLVVAIAQDRASFANDPARFARQQELRQSWLQKLPPGKSLYQYEYYRYAVPGKESQFAPAFFPHGIARDLRSLKGISLGDYIEVYNQEGKVITDLNLYVTGRCWWNADLDVDALLEEYYTLFYGPARDEMKAFIEYSEANWTDLKKVEKIDRLFELMDKARARVDAASDYGRRIALIADYMAPLKALRAQLSVPRDNVPRAVIVSREDAVVKIDGKLDEAAWQNLRVYPLRDLYTGKFTEIKTRFSLFWAHGSVYLGITCEDPDTKALNITATKNDDTSIWNGDTVEIFIETQTHAHYHLAVNPAGALLDADRKGGIKTEWASNAEAAVSIGDKAWTVEMRIPVAPENQDNIDPVNGLAGRMPTTGQPWYFNVGRQRERPALRQLWAFSPTGKGGFNQPRKFAELGGIINDPAEKARKEAQHEAWLKQWE